MFAYKKHKEHDEDVRRFFFFDSRPDLTSVIQDKAEAWARTNWINEARARTEAYRQNGSQEPYTWVLTHGKSIPQGAILVGKEKSWNLYICRAFEDVSLLFKFDVCTKLILTIMASGWYP